MARMTHSLYSSSALAGAFVLLALAAAPAHADFELQDPGGRRILLKDDGTWRYLDAQPPAAADAASAAASAPPPAQAELRIARKQDAPGGCRFDIALKNTLPYEIRNVVPEFSAFRSGGVLYTTQTAAFIGIKPGDELTRSVRFLGIRCAEIEKLQVQGGDRCEAGDLERFSASKGACLARLKLMPTELVQFEK